MSAVRLGPVTSARKGTRAGSKRRIAAWTSAARLDRRQSGGEPLRGGGRVLKKRAGGGGAAIELRDAGARFGSRVACDLEHESRQQLREQLRMEAAAQRTLRPNRRLAVLPHAFLFQQPGDGGQRGVWRAAFDDLRAGGLGGLPEFPDHKV
jgi:hypothetical protein